MTFVPTPPRRARLVGLLALSAAATVAGAALAQPAAAPPADFAVCSACHESTPKAAPSLGPNLFGVGGRKAGAVPDFDYSDAMKASGITWSADTLQAFIVDPAKTVPNNKMDYGGGDAAAAKAIADYLMSLKG
jgi:cytochrome c